MAVDIILRDLLVFVLIGIDAVHFCNVNDL
jgi:hypothetical protein